MIAWSRCAARTKRAGSGASPITVDVGPGLEWLRKGLQACLGPGFAVICGLPERPMGLVLLSGDDPAVVVDFACAHPEASVVAVTGAYGADPDPATAATVIEGGAEDCQTLTSIRVLAAHLRAVARRGPPLSGAATAASRQTT